MIRRFVLVLGLSLAPTIAPSCALWHASHVPAAVRTTTADRALAWGAVERDWPLTDAALRVVLTEDAAAWRKVREESADAPQAFLDVVLSQETVATESARRIELFSPQEKIALVRALREAWTHLEGYYR